MRFRRGWRTLPWETARRGWGGRPGRAAGVHAQSGPEGFVVPGEERHSVRCGVEPERAGAAGLGGGDGGVGRARLGLRGGRLAMRAMPFGADTLVIPFTSPGLGQAAWRVPQMSRMRRAGTLSGRAEVLPPDGRVPGIDGMTIPVQLRRGGPGGTLVQLPGGGWRQLSIAEELRVARCNYAEGQLRRLEPTSRELQSIQTETWVPDEAAIACLEAGIQRARIGRRAGTGQPKQDATGQGPTTSSAREFGPPRVQFEDWDCNAAPGERSTERTNAGRPEEEARNCECE